MAKTFFRLLIVAVLVTMTPASAATLSEDQAINRLITIVQRDRLYTAWTKLECLTFTTEATSAQYFDIAIREKHEGKCLGDPGVSPIVDRFRVFRHAKKILWFRPNDGEFVSYSQVKVWRRK
jgi:hypothetical protein